MSIYVPRASVIASSGHAATHSPQAWHASARTAYALFLPCAHTFAFASSGSAAQSAASIVRTSKTSYGHTATHSALASHRDRLTTGRNAPAAALQVPAGGSGLSVGGSGSSSGYVRQAFASEVAISSAQPLMRDSSMPSIITRALLSVPE